MGATKASNLEMTTQDKQNTHLIAFYLPQFHPIPENDAWWGRGFTEWTNVAKAKPLFPGHYQPHIPADLGFYDLRVPETRIAQAEMARSHGIEGFCYWHYWFAGKRLLERPFNEVLKSGEPNFPFCLAWANHSWTRTWQGAPDRILMEQTYPGLRDYEAHFYAVLGAFADPRYMTIDCKPVFVLFHPRDLPEPRQFTDCWQTLALRAGLKGIYFLGIGWPSWNPNENGFDAAIFDNPEVMHVRLGSSYKTPIAKSYRVSLRKLARFLGVTRNIPITYLYENAIQHGLPPLETRFEQYPCVIPGWDNTPRSGAKGVVLHHSTPEAFQLHLRKAIEQVASKEPEKRLVFLKSWNEWAEGNYLEPDLKFGTAYLEAIKQEIAWHNQGRFDK
jgi:hypothetical protein